MLNINLINLTIITFVYVRTIFILQNTKIIFDYNKVDNNMERSSEIGNNLNESVKINVEKNNGIKERFSYEKLVKSLVMVETPFFE